MAEVFSSDNSVTQEVMDSQVSDEAESLRIGEEMLEAQEQRLAGKYKNTEELEAAYLELQKKLGNQEEEDVQVVLNTMSPSSLAKASLGYLTLSAKNDPNPAGKRKCPGA